MWGLESTMTGVLTGRERDQRGMHTLEERPNMDRVKRQLSASQRKSHQEPNLLTL